MILWKCPNGCPSVRGVSRPRRRDVCRYCLACSAKLGVLVDRSAPVLVRKRERRAEVAGRRTASKAAATAAARVAYPQGWLQAWAGRLLGLKAWGLDLGEKLHSLKIRVARERKRKIDGYSFGIDVTDTEGRVWPAGKVIGGIGEPVYRIHTVQGSSGLATRRRAVVTAGTDRADSLATLIHELAHVAAIEAGHGDAWRSVFFAATEELVGVAPVLGAGAATKERVHQAVYDAIAQSGASAPAVVDPRTWRKS